MSFISARNAGGKIGRCFTASSNDVLRENIPLPKQRLLRNQKLLAPQFARRNIQLLKLRQANAVLPRHALELVPQRRKLGDRIGMIGDKRNPDFGGRDRVVARIIQLEKLAENVQRLGIVPAHR